ncbi:MAG TPA: DUF2076 domain-containing protein [Bradyrhizobium sp.]|nr:DUF2076 domain-containing protein [Bradyrhizobium sp.]
MTPQERQLVDDLFDRLSKMESASRDPDATAAITQGLRIAPNAIYPLVQTVLVQDEALRRANSRIQELEGQGAPQQGQGGFLDTMRGALLGQSQGTGSVPSVRPPEVGSRPVWNSGQVLQQSGHYDEGGYGQSYGGPQAPMGGGMTGGGMMGGGMMGGGMGSGGGGSFLGTAAAAAAGAVGGSLLLNSIRSMMGGSHHGFGDASALADRGSGQSPWTDQSGSSLARDAGINDVGSSGGHSHAGLLDSASNDHDQDAIDDQDDQDDMDADDNDVA